ncbi:hypothetical protein L596_010110 [Steinernema carpocapsae]|uniref:Uncharacterized protein n=1 Tax=Steinernema carpocapsae TaxID=34508 RepID=A0A4U5PHC3_STECR|nr:hypothetical protein L596_010110 [Steinernema carpocapsae]
MGDMDLIGHVRMGADSECHNFVDIYCTVKIIFFKTEGQTTTISLDDIDLVISSDRKDPMLINVNIIFPTKGSFWSELKHARQIYGLKAVILVESVCESGRLNFNRIPVFLRGDLVEIRTMMKFGRGTG